MSYLLGINFWRGRVFGFVCVIVFVWVLGFVCVGL